jgi:hypothetical protein
MLIEEIRVAGEQQQLYQKESDERWTTFETIEHGQWNHTMR